MFKRLGNRLLSALSVTGRFKKDEAILIDDGLDAAVKATPQTTAAAPYTPNRAEKSAARRRNRFRTTRNKAFHAKRNNHPTTDGLTVMQPRLTHENVSNRGIHFMFNTKLNAMLYKSGAMDVGHTDIYEEALRNAHV